MVPHGHPESRQGVPTPLSHTSMRMAMCMAVNGRTTFDAMPV